MRHTKYDSLPCLQSTWGGESSAVCKVIKFTINRVCVQMLNSHVAASTVHAAVRPVSLELLLHPAAISEVRHRAVTVLSDQKVCL